ncbi:MAG: hypothetical protein ACLQIK_12775 [Mycobacterium sp.]|nr:hypothetical protein [Mycobacterium sp.]HKI42134.1 hypothetical protein [Mycobacterium sp.]
MAKARRERGDIPLDETYDADMIVVAQISIDSLVADFRADHVPA